LQKGTALSAMVQKTSTRILKFVT